MAMDLTISFSCGLMSRLNFTPYLWGFNDGFSIRILQRE